MAITLIIAVTISIFCLMSIYPFIYKKNKFIDPNNNELLLKEIVDQLKEAARTSAITIEVAEKLATQDRAQTQLLKFLINNLDNKLVENMDSINRIEIEAAGIALDQSNAHDRANLATTGPPGSKADAAMVTESNSK